MAVDSNNSPPQPFETLEGRAIPPKGFVYFSQNQEQFKYDNGLDIERFYDMKMNRWNFQRINDVLYAGLPAHFYLGLPKSYRRRLSRKNIEICLVPLASFWGMADWWHIPDPVNHCLFVIPRRLSMVLKFFNRKSRISRHTFKNHKFTWYESFYLEYFINALIDPNSKYAKGLERRAKRQAK